MKNVLMLFCMSFSIVISAQDMGSYGKAPSTEVKLYHPSTQTQTTLETIGALKLQKKKLGGFGGISFTYELKGESSPIKISADSAIFVLEQGTGMMAIADISNAVSLYKLEIRGGIRVAVSGDYKSSIIGVGKTTDTKVTTNTKQLKEGLTQILPEKKLEKGEYAFITGMIEGNKYDGKNTKYIVCAFAIE